MTLGVTQLKTGIEQGHGTQPNRSGMKDLWPSATRFWHLIKPGSETVNNPDPDSFRPQGQRSRTQNPKQTRPQPPVERGWVTKPTGAVPWLGGRLVPLACPDRSAAYAAGAADPLLAENSFYLEWGGDDGSRQQRWREFLTHEDPKEQSIRRADWVVGDESFQKRLSGDTKTDPPGDTKTDPLLNTC